MTAPAVKLSLTDRHKLKELHLERSAVLHSGQVWYCRGRSILRFGTIADLPNVFAIPQGTDTLCISEKDYADVKGWLG